MSGNTPVRTFRLDDGRWTRLARFAEAHDITVSDLIRSLVDSMPDDPNGNTVMFASDVARALGLVIPETGETMGPDELIQTYQKQDQQLRDFQEMF